LDVGIVVKQAGHRAVLAASQQSRTGGHGRSQTTFATKSRTRRPIATTAIKNTLSHR
jgi:hypothetical protein